MNMILESKYISEKQAFTKLLIESRMLEITYSETFNLIFYIIISNTFSNPCKYWLCGT